MKKLRKGELVEVRHKEEGLRGAWDEGVVLESPRLYRKVKYKHLLDDDLKDALEENVRVSFAVEGLKNEVSGRRKVKKRGYIRPLPPPLNVEMSLSYGLCVDALSDHAWWEGVVFDNAENSPKRSVFFPDEGDELKIPKENLRVTQDWDEIRGRWQVRGHWMLTKLLDKQQFSIKVVWYYLRTHHHFLCKVGEWIHGKKNDWKQGLSKVLKLLEREPSRQLIPALTALGTQSYLNGEDSFPTGSCGWKNSSQFHNSNMTNDSTLDEDSNPGAIVCCETVDQVWPLDAVVAQGTPIMFSENANKLTERIKKGFCNSLESFSKENCFDEELSKAFRTSSDGHRRQFFTESSKAIGADVNGRPSLAYRKSSSNLQDCLGAIHKYKPKLNKEIKAKTKACLVNQGWRIEVKHRINSTKKDSFYVSPKGNIYNSFHRAYLTWREEQEVERMTDGHWEDVWAKSSTSPPSQDPSVKVKRKIRSSVTKFPKRLWKFDTSQQSPRKDSNNDAFKINNRPRQLVSVVIWNKRLRCNRNKRSSVTREGTSVCGWSSKKRKLNVEGSMNVQKRKEAKRSCHVWKTKDTPANWHRMPELPSTPGKLNDSSSCQDKPTDIFNLSWLIENDVVAKNQQVFFLYGKNGWITCEGILCACCYMVYSLTSFEAHAGSKVHPFSVNLRLDDGRSLAQCQMQALRKRKRGLPEDKRTTRAPSKENKKQGPLNKKTMTNPSEEHDDFCFVCRQNGLVTLCDRCTRSFHEKCVYPEKIPVAEKWIKWFCPNCRCDICGGGEFSDDENFTESTALFCDQCECVFHVGCLERTPELSSCPKGKWFCSQKCSEIFSKLRSLVGKVNPVGDGLSWTLLRSTKEDRDPTRDEILAKGNSDPLFDEVMTKRKLNVAMSLMRMSFNPMTDYRTRKDYIEEIIFNRGRERNFLKFQGFYTAILEKGNKIVSVATVRIHGKRVAELPFISTRHQYRRKGMCRLLINELEKLLSSLHVEKIVLLAVYELERTWQESFGFQKMTSEEIFDLLKLDIVHSPDSIMLQKILMGPSPEQEILTEIDDTENRAEGMHQSLGNVYGLEIQEEIVPENPEISACKIRSYTEFVESVTPLSRWPGKTNRYLNPHSISAEGGSFSGKLQSLSEGFQHSGSVLRRRCRIHKNKIEKIECHPGKTPMEDDVDESSVVIMGTTRSNRLVKQVKRKVGYSCSWEEHKPMRSAEHYLDRKIYKKRIKDKIIFTEKFPATPPADAMESSQKKDIQFGICEIRKSDDGKSIVCKTNSGIADGNHLSNVKADESILDRSVLEHESAHVAIKADEPILDGSVLEHGSDHVAINKENLSGNSHTVNYNENCRESCYGHLGAQYSFKYVYTRRRKHICS